LLQKIQKAGKLVSAFCGKSELETLYQELRPEGTHFIVSDCTSPEEADEVLASVEKWTT
jgi:hypothetical protein